MLSTFSFPFVCGLWHEHVHVLCARVLVMSAVCGEGGMYVRIVM